MHSFDIAIVGAGAAGLFCASIAGQLGHRVVLLDHADKLAEKIRISGGGRCNFTNIGAGHANYLSQNPAFCRSALARYTPQHFLELVKRHGIAFHEKHKGQLFCDESAEQIIRMLTRECEAGHVERWQPCTVDTVQRSEAGFVLQSSRGEIHATKLVVATGGLPIPKIGATDWGLRLARQFGHAVIDPQPALVPLTFDPAMWQPFVSLAGLSLPVLIRTGSGKKRMQFHEDLLFTHRGLSGPAILQISSYWTAGQSLSIDLHPEESLLPRLLEMKQHSKRQLGNTLAECIPQRLAQLLIEQSGLPAQRPMPEVKDKDLQALAQRIHHWDITPNGTEGWRKAEVMRGGIDTRELNSQSMESRLVPGLHFIGEVLDVTGWLGGYNFQWAWASAVACAQSFGEAKPSA